MCVKGPLLRGVLNNFPIYFLSFLIIFTNLYILKSFYINYNPLFQIITQPTS
jgi:hypothetical protein